MSASNIIDIYASDVAFSPGPTLLFLVAEHAGGEAIYQITGSSGRASRQVRIRGRHVYHCPRVAALRWFEATGGTRGLPTGHGREWLPGGERVTMISTLRSFAIGLSVFIAGTALMVGDEATAVLFAVLAGSYCIVGLPGGSRR